MMGNLRYGTSVIGVGTDESALRRRARPVRQSRLQDQGPQSQASRRIREPEDVRGKTILCTTVSSAHFALTAWLDAVGVKPTEVTIKNMDQPQALAAFENGIGDFVALWAPHMYAGTDKGWKVAGSAALCGKGTPLVLVADTKYADAHPEITAKFLSVYLRGVEHLRTTSVDELIPEYQRFFFDWAGKTYSKELARLDLESHTAWDIKGQLALFDTSKGMSTVQQWQADTAQFSPPSAASPRMNSRRSKTPPTSPTSSSSSSSNRFLPGKCPYPALSRIPAGEGFSFSQSLFSPQFRLIPEAHTGLRPLTAPPGRSVCFSITKHTDIIWFFLYDKRFVTILTSLGKLPSPKK